MDLTSILTIIGFILLIVLTIKVYGRFNKKESDFNPIRFMARVAVFGAISTILYVVPIFNIKLPIFPSFLSIHFDEVPAFICGYAYGPVAAIAVLLVKTFIKLPFTSTLTVGEWTDLILSSVFVVTSCLIYKKHRTLKGAVVGFLISSAVQIVVAMFLNVYVMIPFYSNVMGYPISALLSMMQKAIPAISDIQWSYALLCVLPFNALKDFVVFIFVFLIYRSLHVVLRFKKS
ncbi:MAG: ECF transporter S component [Bacilli bacterium]|nr:ECF transporter S component [Bacilli bacterium]